MKKAIVTIGVVAMLTSCGNQSSTSETSMTDSTVTMVDSTAKSVDTTQTKVDTTAVK